MSVCDLSLAAVSLGRWGPFAFFCFLLCSDTYSADSRARLLGFGGLWPNNLIIPPFFAHRSRDSKSTCSVRIIGSLSEMVTGNCLCIGHSNLAQNTHWCSSHSHFLNYYSWPWDLPAAHVLSFRHHLLSLHIPFLQRLVGRIAITRCALCDFSFSHIIFKLRLLKP